MIQQSKETLERRIREYKQDPVIAAIRSEMEQVLSSSTPQLFLSVETGHITIKQDERSSKLLARLQNKLDQYIKTSYSDILIKK